MSVARRPVEERACCSDVINHSAIRRSAITNIRELRRMPRISASNNVPTCILIRNVLRLFAGSVGRSPTCRTALGVQRGTAKTQGIVPCHCYEFLRRAALFLNIHRSWGESDPFGESKRQRHPPRQSSNGSRRGKLLPKQHQQERDDSVNAQ